MSRFQHAFKGEFSWDLLWWLALARTLWFQTERCVAPGVAERLGVVCCPRMLDAHQRNRGKNENNDNKHLKTVLTQYTVEQTGKTLQDPNESKFVCLSTIFFFYLSRAELDITTSSIDRIIRNGCSPSKKIYCLTLFLNETVNNGLQLHPCAQLSTEVVTT